MNKEVKEKWLKALRSGEYLQGVHQLRCGDKYCCLGVLSDLYIKETNDGEWVRNDDGEHVIKIGNKMMLEVLPTVIVNWSGLPDMNPNVMGETETIACLNDNGLTFNEIADLIEKEF